MNNTKSLTQYSDSNIEIYVYINKSGGIRARSQLMFKGSKSISAKKYRDNNKIKEHTNTKTFTQYYDEDVYIICAVCADGTFYYRTKTKSRLLDSKIARKYAKTDKGKVSYRRSNKKYSKTPAGKITKARSQAKRKRELGYNPMNEWFSGCEGHHLNKEDILFIPTSLHRSVSHSVIQDRNMKEINDTAFEWLCTQESL